MSALAVESVARPEPHRTRLGAIRTHGYFPCKTCHLPHHYRLVENHRFPEQRRYSWADPKDGHAYSHDEQNTYEVLSEALHNAERRIRRLEALMTTMTGP